VISRDKRHLKILHRQGIFVLAGTIASNIISESLTLSPNTSGTEKSLLPAVNNTLPGVSIEYWPVFYSKFLVF
jgi:hypothetical protein